MKLEENKEEGRQKKEEEEDQKVKLFVSIFRPWGLKKESTARFCYLWLRPGPILAPADRLSNTY